MLILGLEYAGPPAGLMLCQCPSPGEAWAGRDRGESSRSPLRDEPARLGLQLLAGLGLSGDIVWWFNSSTVLLKEAYHGKTRNAVYRPMG